MIIVGMTGTIIALTGLYRHVWRLGLSQGFFRAVVGITVLALIGALTLAWVRKFLWGDGAKPVGWVSGHVTPWLRTTWWGGLTVLGGFLALAAVIGLVLRHWPARKVGYRRPKCPRWATSAG
jgi:hypothetical protein